MDECSPDCACFSIVFGVGKAASCDSRLLPELEGNMKMFVHFSLSGVWVFCVWLPWLYGSCRGCFGVLGSSGSNLVSEVGSPALSPLMMASKVSHRSGAHDADKGDEITLAITEHPMEVGVQAR